LNRRGHGKQVPIIGRGIKRAFGISIFTTDRVATLIAWMLVVRVDDLVKDGAKRRRLRRSMILDKNINANRVLSKRSRPLSRPSYIFCTLTA
jgi:hypothetical protein